jgi:hypothetical protein
LKVRARCKAFDMELQLDHGVGALILLLLHVRLVDCGNVTFL